jgi:hypothetical protein
MACCRECGDEPSGCDALKLVGWLVGWLVSTYSTYNKMKSVSFLLCTMFFSVLYMKTMF